jgi:hypothetical protein
MALLSKEISTLKTLNVKHEVPFFKKWQNKEEKKWLQQDFMRIIILISGRGRRRHFFVTPSVRTVRKLFDRYPTSMNIFCYGTLFSTADMSQQTIQHHYKVT